MRMNLALVCIGAMFRRPNLARDAGRHGPRPLVAATTVCCVIVRSPANQAEAAVRTSALCANGSPDVRRLISIVGALRTPNAFHRQARGCEKRANLGIVREKASTPKGLHPASATVMQPLQGCSGFRGASPRVARAAQPWA